MLVAVCVGVGVREGVGVIVGVGVFEGVGVCVAVGVGVGGTTTCAHEKLMCESPVCWANCSSSAWFPAVNMIEPVMVRLPLLAKLSKTGAMLPST